MVQRSRKLIRGFEAQASFYSNFQERCRMRALLAAICLVTFSIVLFGQADRGTITGTVSGPAGAVVPNASGRGEKC